jgi:hypothetical protein
MDDVPILAENVPPREWLDALAEAEADRVAGRATPWPEARARLLRLLDDSGIQSADRPA